MLRISMLYLIISQKLRRGSFYKTNTKQSGDAESLKLCWKLVSRHSQLNRVHYDGFLQEKVLQYL